MGVDEESCVGKRVEMTRRMRVRRCREGLGRGTGREMDGRTLGS